MSSTNLSSTGVNMYTYSGIDKMFDYKSIFLGMVSNGLLRNEFIDNPNRKTSTQSWEFLENDIVPEKKGFNTSETKAFGAKERSRTYHQIMHMIKNNIAVRQGLSVNEVVEAAIPSLERFFDGKMFYDNENNSFLNEAEGCHKENDATFTSGATLYSKIKELYDIYQSFNYGVAPLVLVGNKLSSALTGVLSGDNTTVAKFLKDNGLFQPFTDPNNNEGVGLGIFTTVYGNVYSYNKTPETTDYFGESTIAMLNPTHLILKHGLTVTSTNAIRVKEDAVDGTTVAFVVDSPKLEILKEGAVVRQKLTQA